MFRLLMIATTLALMALAAAGCAYEEHDYCDPYEPVGRRWEEPHHVCDDGCHHRPHRHYGHRYDRW